MEQVNATQAARNLSDLLNRVACQGKSFELTRGGQRIARLVPVGPPSQVKVSELLVGVHRADSEQRRIRRSAFVEAVLSVLPFH